MVNGLRYLRKAFTDFVLPGHRLVLRPVHALLCRNHDALSGQ
jgi:hypothetical protein